jgi:peptidoglycan/LPS O-acetylase OafA/YrhL
MSAERASFRSDVEGLRGIAILLVVAFHAGVSWAAGGYVGVDIFFVISGYFITALLAREVASTGDVDLSEFYARRARRLLPAFLLVLVATLAAALWLYAPIDQRPIASDARAVALSSGNILFARSAVNYHAASENPFLHTWSLAVEEQFYLIWPLLFAWIGRAYGFAGATHKRLITWVAVAGVVSFVASVWVTRVAQPWAFFGMPTRIWEFALGGLAALLVSTQARRPRGTLLQLLGLAAIGIAALVFHDATPYPGVAALLPTLGTVALLVGGEAAPTGLVTRLLDARWLRWLGRLSYSWYLWHWPLVGAAAVVDWEIGVQGRLLWSAVALVLAWLTYRFVEEPIRHGGVLRDRPYVLNAVALGASVGVAMMAHASISIADRNASSPEQQQYAAAREDGMAHDCWGSLLENATAPCLFGDTSSRTTVVLMGDSHAEHWLPAMDRIGRERGWKIVAMVKPACPVADVEQLVSSRLKRYYTECTQWRRSMLSRIVKLHPDAVILSSYDHYVDADGARSASGVTPAVWREGLRRTYRRLSDAGISTVAIRDVPSPGFDVPACLSRRASRAPFTGKACEYDLARSLRPEAVGAQIAAARGVRRLAVIDMNDRVCSTPRCRVVRGGAIVYRDGDHLTATFSESQAPILAERILASVPALRGSP